MDQMSEEQPSQQDATLPSRERMAFFREFLKHPLQIGSVIPSSRFLEKRVLKKAELSGAKTVVELGAGTGGITRAILGAMAPEARLLSIEINPRFYDMIRTIDDERLIAHLGSACELQEILSTYGLGAADAIISGIPFSTMSPSIGADILAAISSTLGARGRFVAYQVSDRVAALSRPFLGHGRMDLEFLNIPPMRVFVWEKQSA